MPENLPSISSCTSVDISSQSDKNNSNNESHKHGDRDLDSVSSFDSQFNYEDVTLRPPHQCFDRSRSWIANSLNHIDDNVDSPQLSQIQTNDNDAISTNNGLEVNFFSCLDKLLLWTLTCLIAFLGRRSCPATQTRIYCDQT